MIVLKRLAGLAAILNMLLMMFVYGMCFGSSFYGMDKLAWPLVGLVLLNYPLLIISYNLRSKRAVKIGCAVGLAFFALTVAAACGCWWFHENGVWQPWSGLQQAEHVELAPYGSNKGVILTEEEAAAAKEMVAGLWVQNPCVSDGDSIHIPEDMPPMTGELAGMLVFYDPEGGRDYISVRYPYYGGGHLAADLEACREVEAFINGLSEKYK